LFRQSVIDYVERSSKASGRRIWVDAEPFQRDSELLLPVTDCMRANDAHVIEDKQVLERTLGTRSLLLQTQPNGRGFPLKASPVA
jgi:hypothetical protein